MSVSEARLEGEALRRKVARYRRRTGQSPLVSVPRGASRLSVARQNLHTAAHGLDELKRGSSLEPWHRYLEAYNAFVAAVREEGA